MNTKWLAWPLLAVLALVLAWLYREPLGLASRLPAAGLPGAAALGRLLGQPLSTATPSTATQAVGGARKCVVEGKVLYTNDACPSGSQEQAIRGGTVNTLSAPTSPPAPGSGTSSPPHVRKLLIPADEVNIKDKRMEEVIGK